MRFDTKQASRNPPLNHKFLLSVLLIGKPILSRPVLQMNGPFPFDSQTTPSGGELELRKMCRLLGKLIIIFS